MTAPRDPALVWLDELRLSRPAELHRRVTDLEAQTLSAELAIDALIQRLDQLEDRMANTDQQVGRVGDPPPQPPAGDLPPAQ